MENSISSGISGSAAEFVNSGLRSIGHSGVIVNNITTKSGGSNSTKVGLEVNSTGSWGPSTTNQPNVGVKVTASGADENYAVQLVDGSEGAGKVLMSDANGNAHWKSLPGEVHFQVHLGADEFVPVATWTYLNYNVVEYNSGSFDIGSDMFTAPADGIYHFDANVEYDSPSTPGSGANIIMRLEVDGVETKRSVCAVVEPPSGAAGAGQISADIFLSAGQTVKLATYHDLSFSNGALGGQPYCYFSGRKVN